MALIPIIISIILLIIFLVMASGISTIKNMVRGIKNSQLVRYTCGSCKTDYLGKHANCPYCQTKQSYK